MMPQDHASLDRKDIFRQRKHERSEQSFDPTLRWRNSPTIPSHLPRWESCDIRRPPGHVQNNGMHQFVEGTHGYPTSRPNARGFEDDYYRPSAPRGEWRYTRAFRNEKGSFSQKDWKCQTWEMNNGSSRSFDRSCGIRNDRRSVGERPSHASDSHSTVVSSWDPANYTRQPDSEVCNPVQKLEVDRAHNFKDQKRSLPSDPHSGRISFCEQPYTVDKHNDKLCSSENLCLDIKSGQELPDDRSLQPSISHTEPLHLQDLRDNLRHDISGLKMPKQISKESLLQSIDWKHPVWAHSETFASQGSGFSDSSHSKSLGAADSSDQNTRVLPKTVAVIESPSGDAAVCLTSSYLPEEMISRKKQRVRWGEGLAKYEKKKIDVNTNDDETTLSISSTEEMCSLNKIPVYKMPGNKSPTTACVLDYCSPATPSSVAYSSSLGSAEKSTGKASLATSNASNLCHSPSPVSSSYLEGFPVNLQEVNNISLDSVGCFLSELLHTDDLGLGDSSSVQLTAVNKLLTWKANILKALEATESEIDLLENEKGMVKVDAKVPEVEEATCVAETTDRASVHNDFSGNVPVDAFEDSPVTVQSLPRSAVCVIADGCLKTNGENIELSSGGCSVASCEDASCSMILASNRKSANKASESLNELLPRAICFYYSRFSSLCQSEVNSHVKQKVEARRELLRVKEKILLLRYKAFQLSWKKGLDEIPLSKCQSKSQKTFHAEINDYLKDPQHAHLRLSYPELLLDSHLKPKRESLRMPSMILDVKERVMSKFISSNGLIEDPCAVEAERTVINLWTSEEREIFLNKLAAYGKDFKKIALYLPHKTTADCIDFYYKNHKADCFGKIKKQNAYVKEGKHTYMLAPQKKWKREIGATSLDILGVVSAVAANEGKIASTRQISSKQVSLRGWSNSRNCNSFERCSYRVDLHRENTVSGHALAGGCDTWSSEPIGSFSRTHVGVREKFLRHQNTDRTVKRLRISVITRNDEDDSCSEESGRETGSSDWTDDERSAFIQGFSLYGKNFELISRFVRTRSQDQCRVFFSKVRKCLGLELIPPAKSRNARTSASGSEGGGSDMENLCALETSDGSYCVKMGKNLDSSSIKNQGKVKDSGSLCLAVDLNKSEEENGRVCLRLEKNAMNVESNALSNQGCPDLVLEPEPCPTYVRKAMNDTEEDTSKMRMKLETEGVMLPKHNRKYEDGARNRIRNSSLEAEYVHHFGSVSPKRCGVVELDERHHRRFGQKQNGLKKLNVIRTPGMQELERRRSRSKSDVMINKCNSSVHSRSHSLCLSDTERSKKSGDIKLFGAILTSLKNDDKSSI